MRVNSVYKQETKVSTRSFRFPMVILLFNGVLALVVLLNMYSVITQVRRTAEIQYSSFVNLYVFVASVEFALLLFLIPAITAGSISGEKERQTLDLMLTTRMSSLDIVLGKLFAGLSTILLLIVSSFPILSMTFVYGGILLKDIVLLLLCYSVTGFLTGSIGIFCSACFKKSAIATAVSYCLTTAVVAGTVAVNHLASLFLQITSTQGNKGSSGWFYLLLANPASIFRMALNSQMGRELELAGVFPWLTQRPDNVITEYWLIFGVIVQSAIACLLLWMAAKQIEPCKRKRKR